MLSDEEWTDKVAQWRASGQSARAWCRDHNIAYQLFILKRKKLQRVLSISFPVYKASDPFLELSQSSDNTSNPIKLALEYQGVIIRLSRDFDALTLKRCFQLLKGW